MSPTAQLLGLQSGVAVGPGAEHTVGTERIASISPSTSRECRRHGGYCLLRSSAWPTANMLRVLCQALRSQAPSHPVCCKSWARCWHQAWGMLQTPGTSLGFILSTLRTGKSEVLTPNVSQAIANATPSGTERQLPADRQLTASAEGTDDATGTESCCGLGMRSRL